MKCLFLCPRRVASMSHETLVLCSRRVAGTSHETFVFMPSSGGKYEFMKRLFYAHAGQQVRVVKRSEKVG